MKFWEDNLISSSGIALEAPANETLTITTCERESVLGCISSYYEIWERREGNVADG